MTMRLYTQLYKKITKRTAYTSLRFPMADQNFTRPIMNVRIPLYLSYSKQIMLNGDICGQCQSAP